MANIAAALVPLVLLIGVGYVLTRTGFFSDALKEGLNKFVFWIGIPSLIIHGLANAPSEINEATLVFIALFLATLAALLLAYPVAALLRLSWADAGTFSQAVFRGNNAFVGVPVVLQWYGDPDPRITALAFLVLAPSMIMYNVFAVVVLALSQDGRHILTTLGSTLQGIVTNPLILSSVVGIGLNLLGWTLPQPMDKTIEMLGETAVPLALLGVGAGLLVKDKARRLLPPVVASIGKLIVVPLLAWPMGVALGLDRDGLAVLLIFAACPAAVASYIMASQMGGNPRMAATSIVYSTVGSFVTLAVLLWLLT